ncbi:zinc-containing alcohol dehydrogenase [Sporothrix brasiliensis 5110]|uniref:Zinc-containing alcohol dehydrogenase n=1 Tax=Sporothrix brasiliensis 5110 TaxID=1398154 RepID=A0A0C2ISL3_9PEZI|nr:zinc-containing alcohol dehydrogenase [Sporothrix brasiliensis 5110]KIH89840.1 zinc-containing alcohol dehydrogenase [Sporothrix brasiliensis 5110]
MALPTKTDEWVLAAPTGVENAYRLNKGVPLPALGNKDVLLEIKAVSLNFRDVAIAMGAYPLPTKFPLVPCCDASAVVLATGASVTSVAAGDGVIVLPAPLFQSGHMTTATFGAPGDGFMPGLLRRHAVLPASWVARFPRFLSFVEASTLGVAGVTAWNILAPYGLGAPDAAVVKPGSWVLTQGTGAVSLFAAEFAVRLGAVVVGTTSSDAKKHWLTDLGVTTVINYNEDPLWGETARRLTPDGEGVDLVVDVGGTGTLGESLKAIRYDGTVAVTGFLTGDSTAGPSVMDVLPRAANVRGVLAGSRAHYEEMARMIEQWQFHPKVDDEVFQFEDANTAVQYLAAQKHIGKVVIEVSPESRAA